MNLKGNMIYSIGKGTTNGNVKTQFHKNSHHNMPHFNTQLNLTNQSSPLWFLHERDFHSFYSEIFPKAINLIRKAIKNIRIMMRRVRSST